MTLAGIPMVPYLNALTVEDEKASGRTRPIVMSCVSVDGVDAQQYVVKLRGAVELGVRALARELFAALLGHQLGLNVPEPAVVNISGQLAMSSPNGEVRKRLGDSVGSNYGSCVITPVYGFSFLPDDQIGAAADVFAFDVLLMNYDRRSEKHNLFLNPSGFVVFDHEMAFPYADPRMMIGGVPEPWKLQRMDKLFIGHLLYPWLKRKSNLVRFDGFVSRLRDMSNDVLFEIASRIPPEWTCDERPEMSNVCAFLAKARDNSSRLERCLLEVLA